MEEEYYNYEVPNKIYIKSNTATVMHLLSFLSAILLIVVAGLCTLAIISYKQSENYYFDKSRQFYFTVENGSVTILKFINSKAIDCEVPNRVKYRGKTYSVTAIGENAFTNHRSLVTVTIPDSVTEIRGSVEDKKGAFSGCTALTTINMGKSISRIGAYAFKNCVALKSIDVPASVQFVHVGAFQNCLDMTTIKINGNSAWDTNSFINCYGVTTLQIADGVELNDDVRPALASLTSLVEFVSFNPAYQTDERGDCLLNAAKDTVVLGGNGAMVPAGVTKILDWAWGKRTVDKSFVPGLDNIDTEVVEGVKEIGEHAFADQIICTDAKSRPQSWKTTVPVYTHAQLVEFRVTGYQSTKAYVYQDENGIRVDPDYYDLFPHAKSPTPFKRWGTFAVDENGTTTCEAIYESEKKGSEEVVSLLNSDLGRAEEFINGAYSSKLRFLFKIEFWEKFKMYYYQAVAAIENSADTYDYIMSYLSDGLDEFSSKIRPVYKILKESDDDDSVWTDENIDRTVLESTDWYIGLQNLVDAIDQLEEKDIISVNSATLIERIYTRKEEAEKVLSEDGFGLQMNPVDFWRAIRESFESLKVDVSPDGPLGSLIAECEKLDRANYTKESWANLQSCLSMAKMVSEYNQSISVIRNDLETALANLCEIGITVGAARLDAWISICEDLQEADYVPSGYDLLMLELGIVKNKRARLLTSSTIDAARVDLQNRYDLLVALNNTSEYLTDAGYFNINTLAFFIITAILFTGAVVAGATAVRLKLLMRRSHE